MVSLIWSPAASVAFTRRLTKAPGGAVNVTLNRPPPAAVTVAGCQVVPPLTDTATVAPASRITGATVAELLLPGRDDAVNGHPAHVVQQGHHRLHGTPLRSVDADPPGREAGARAAGRV